jgi:hypothetical protein
VPTNVMATLRKAVQELEAERARTDRQLAALRVVLSTWDGARGRVDGALPQVSTRRRRRMNAAARRAVSQRMKAYWAKRRASAKGKGKGAPKRT